MKKLVLIDTFNFLHRAYHALPKTFTDRNGEPINAVYGVTSMLISVFKQLEPDYVVVAMDDAAPTQRHEDFTGYKAHRRPMEDDLSVQIPKVLEVVDAFGLNRITVPGYEADDIIGTMVERYKDEVEVVIVSNDRDMWQLVDDNVFVMNPGKNGVADWIGPKEVVAKFGFEPELVVDYKGLRGDPSDNIPGVHGVGEKTATKLILEYGNVDKIYENIEEITPESLKKKLAENYEQAIMSRELARIIRDAPIQTKLLDCKYTTFNVGQVKDVLEKYNFKSLIKRLGFEVDGSPGGDSKKQKSAVPENQMNLFSDK